MTLGAQDDEILGVIVVGVSVYMVHGQRIIPFAAGPTFLAVRFPGLNQPLRNLRPVFMILFSGFWVHSNIAFFCPVLQLAAAGPGAADI